MVQLPRTGCSTLGVEVIGQWAEVLVGVEVPFEVGFWFGVGWVGSKQAFG